MNTNTEKQTATITALHRPRRPKRRNRRAAATLSRYELRRIIAEMIG